MFLGREYDPLTMMYGRESDPEPRIPWEEAVSIRSEAESWQGLGQALFVLGSIAEMKRRLAEAQNDREFYNLRDKK